MSTYNNHLFCLRQQVGSLNRLYRPSPQERGALLFSENGKENASALNIVLTVRPNQAKSKAAESTSLPTALIVFIELVLSQLGKGANFVELGVTPRVCCAHLSGADGAAALLRAGARIDDGFPHVSHGALPPDLFAAAGRDHLRCQRAVERRVPLRGNAGTERFQIVEAFEHLASRAIGTSGLALRARRDRGAVEMPQLAAPPSGTVGTDGDIAGLQAPVFALILLCGDLGLEVGKAFFARDDRLARAHGTSAPPPAVREATGDCHECPSGQRHRMRIFEPVETSRGESGPFFSRCHCAATSG